MKKIITRADLLIVAAAVILLLVLSFAFIGGGKPTATVTVRGETVAEIDLAAVKASYELPLDCDPAITLLVEPGAVSVKSAGCRDRLCMKKGKLTKPGDTAVCLPAGVSVSIEGSGGYDAVVY